MRCRVNFNNHLEKYPLDDTVLKTKKNLIEWLVNIHNEVNIMHNKPIMTPNEVMLLYLKKPTNFIDVFYSPIFQKILLTIIIIIIIYFILQYYQSKNNRLNVNII